jgi:hypothetical protein
MQVNSVCVRIRRWIRKRCKWCDECKQQYDNDVVDYILSQTYGGTDHEGID